MPFFQKKKKTALSHHYIEYHHQHETNGKADCTEVGMLTSGGFGDEFFDHDIEHGACSKGKHIGKNGYQ